jgi:hypothetical protein
LKETSNIADSQSSSKIPLLLVHSAGNTCRLVVDENDCFVDGQFHIIKHYILISIHPCRNSLKTTPFTAINSPFSFCYVNKNMQKKHIHIESDSISNINVDAHVHQWLKKMFFYA